MGCNRTKAGAAGCVEIKERQWTFDGNYFVIEGFFSNALTSGSIRPTTGTSPHHFALRHVEITIPQRTTGSCTSLGTASHAVLFRNNLHDCGDRVRALTQETDVHGIQISRSDTVWILENEIFHNGGDAVQLNAGQSSPDPRSRFTYIGRNHMWENGENALDVKTAQDVIFTSNVLHGYRPSAGSDGAAVVINDENATPVPGDWRLFIFNNSISESAVAVRAQSYAYIFGNDMFDIAGWCAVVFGGESETWWENNTCVGTGGTFRRFGGSTGTAFRFRNNLFCGQSDPNLKAEVNNAATTDPATDIRNNVFPPGLTYSWRGGSHPTLEGWELASGGKAYQNRSDDSGLRAAIVDRGTGELTSYRRFLGLYGIEVDYDRRGTKRPSDGLWDVGAYEVTGDYVSPRVAAPPRNLRIVP